MNLLQLAAKATAILEANPELGHTEVTFVDVNDDLVEFSSLEVRTDEEGISTVELFE